jgi:hypothetical protein
VSPRSARLLALPFAALSLAAHLAGEFWGKPLAWRLDSAIASFLVYFGTATLSLLVPLGIYLLVTRAARRQPSTLLVSASASSFMAGPSVKRTGPIVIALGWLTAVTLPTERIPNGDQMRVATFSTSLLIVTAVLMTIMIVAISLRMVRPHLTLNPDGVRTQSLFRHTAMAWDQLDRTGTTSPSRDEKTLHVNRTGHLVAGAPSTSVKIPVSDLHIDPDFLAATIRHYVEHPEHRYAIGTADELRRLQSTLSGPGGHHL